MDIVTLLNNLKASLDALQAQLVDAQAAAQTAYDAGFAAGVASVVPPVGPTQEELDAANAKIAELEAKVAEVQAALDQSIADVDAKVAQAVATLRDKAKAIFDAYEAQEDQTAADAKAQIDALAL